jgi:hypothetical protein
MSIWCGVNAPIVNPAAKEMVETILAADLLKRWYDPENKIVRD